MGFDFQRLAIEDVILVTPSVYGDDRGYFEETYKETDFRKNGISATFCQDNHSFSVAGTLRGLHFQNPPHAQGKLVRCVKGKILDVAVDIRSGSPHFAGWVQAELSEENHRMLWIPEGFAHGFLALEDSHVEYKVTREYNRESEDGIVWDDPDIGIQWGTTTHLVSPKDQKWKGLNDRKFHFSLPKGDIG